MPNPSLYFHTIRHLKPGQAFSRLTRRVCGRAGGLSFDGALSSRVLSVRTPWLAKRAQEPGGFSFINLRKEFPAGGIDWRSGEMPKLWRYNLHYFDYLLDGRREVGERGGYITDWIGKNPAGAADAWEPFPVSLRIVNWIKFFLAEGRGRVRPEWLGSLGRQAMWLERNLEHHLLANHLFKNAKALLFAGLFFEGADAGRWREKGLRLLRREIGEQVLPDGGHFERSPMYHGMILEDCLDLLNLCRGSGVAEGGGLGAELEDACRRMMRFLLGTCHPDGEIALFNDAALGIEARPEELVGYCERVMGETCRAPEGRAVGFADTGYFVMAPRAGDRLIVDCGPVGPDYQPGHSHCDTLSFELSVGGRRVVVDSGCCQYEEGEIREYNRGNAGHNTVTVDGENQSEVWGAHRCGRRARPVYARLEEGPDGSIAFEGAHDGYRRLKGSPIHHRRIVWAGNGIAVEDRIEGRGVHSAESSLHIHPDLTVERAGSGVRIRDSNRVNMLLSPAGQGAVEIGRGWYCPEFNRKAGCPVVRFKLRDASLPAEFGWTLDLSQGS